MSNLDKHISDSRRWLVYPTSTPSDSTLAEFGIEILDEKITELNQTDEPWFLLTQQLQLEPGTALYSLANCANFGKVRYLYTAADDSSSTFCREPIPLVSMETLTQWFQGGDNVPTLPADSAPWWASYPLAAAAYYLQSTPGPANFLEFGPVPQETRNITLIYEPDVIRPTARAQGFRLNQFDSMIAMLMAKRAVLYCEWKGISDEQASKRRSDIVGLINAELGSRNNRQGLEYLWWQFKNRSMANATTTTIPFGVW